MIQYPSRLVVAVLRNEELRLEKSCRNVVLVECDQLLHELAGLLQPCVCADLLCAESLIEFHQLYGTPLSGHILRSSRRTLPDSYRHGNCQ